MQCCLFFFLFLPPLLIPLSSWGFLFPSLQVALPPVFLSQKSFFQNFGPQLLFPIPFPWVLLHASLITSLSPKVVWCLLIFLGLLLYLGSQRALWPWFSSRGSSGLMRSMKDMGPPNITPSSTYARVPVVMLFHLTCSHNRNRHCSQLSRLLILHRQ